MKGDWASQVSEKAYDRFAIAGLFVLVAVVLAKLLIHLYASRNYGYFIDEGSFRILGFRNEWP
jgi:hypothetical protein